MFNINRTYALTTGVKSKGLAVLNDNKTTYVIQHRTIVFKAPSGMLTNGFIEINNGGWDTVSTRMTINQALWEYGSSYRLARIKGQTYLIGSNGFKTVFGHMARFKNVLSL